jgi:hypothetical protein
LTEVNNCPNCQSPLVSHAKFCTACGTSLDSVEPKKVAGQGANNDTGLRLNRLGVILLLVGIAVYLSSPVSHFFSQAFNCISDDPTELCGSAAPKNENLLSAALLVIAATVSFVGHQWLEHSDSQPSRRNLLYGAIALLVILGLFS